MALSILNKHPKLEDLVFVGVQRRGVVLAKRLAKFLQKEIKHEIPVGTLDISLYRDDLGTKEVLPEVRQTYIPVHIDGKGILLCDEVIFTGRTVRAALDAIMDLGRPQFIELAVLVNREGRELPIEANYEALKVEVAPRNHIQVSFEEIDGEEGVFKA